MRTVLDHAKISVTQYRELGATPVHDGSPISMWVACSYLPQCSYTASAFLPNLFWPTNTTVS
jgi:hypothetical protein